MSFAWQQAPRRAVKRHSRVFAVRGATTVTQDQTDAILSATDELMRELMRRNRLAADDLISCIFTVTDDLSAVFPAVAARRLGLARVPLLNAQEIPVPGSMPRVVRTLLHYNAEKRHIPQPVYMREARLLRPDLSSGDNANERACGRDPRQEARNPRPGARARRPRRRGSS